MGRSVGLRADGIHHPRFHVLRLQPYRVQILRGNQLAVGDLAPRSLDQLRLPRPGGFRLSAPPDTVDLVFDKQATVGELRRRLADTAPRVFDPPVRAMAGPGPAG